MDAVLARGFKLANLLRHERQPAGEQGLPGGQDHPLPARHPGLFRLGLGRRQPGAVPFRARPDQGLHRRAPRRPGRHPARRQLRGGGDPHPGRLRPGPRRQGRGLRPGRLARSSAPAGSRSSSGREREAPATTSGRSPNSGRPKGAYAFDTLTGKLFIDRTKCAGLRIEGMRRACAPKILKLEDGKPGPGHLARGRQKGEVHGVPGLRDLLPLPRKGGHRRPPARFPAWPNTGPG